MPKPSVEDFLIDFGKEEQGGGSPRVKPDTYRARIIGSKTGLSEQKGTPYLEVHFRLLDGSAGKKKVVIKEKMYASPKAYSRFRLLLQACGKKVPAKVNMSKIAAAIKGSELFIEMEDEPPREGYDTPRSRVAFQGFINPDDYDSDVEDDEEEEDFEDEEEDEDEDLEEDEEEEDEEEEDEEEEEEEPAPKRRRGKAAAKPARKPARKRRAKPEPEEDEEDEEEEEDEEPEPPKRRKRAASKSKRKAADDDDELDDLDLDQL